MNKYSVVVGLAVCLLFMPLSQAKEQEKGVEIAFFVDFVTQNPVDAIYFDVETQILTRHQAIKKAKLREKFIAERAELYAKYPKPETDDPVALKEWTRVFDKEAVKAKEILVKMMEIHGPKATVRLYKSDCPKFEQGMVFQMKYEGDPKMMEDNRKNGLLLVEYSALYKPVVISD